MTRNELLAEIVVLSGGTITDNTRNGLLRDWLSAVGGDAPPIDPPTITRGAWTTSGAWQE